MNRSILLGAIVSIAVMVSGCGSIASSQKHAVAGGDYCESLKQSAALVTAFATSDEPDYGTFDELLGAAKNLKSTAPVELTADWAALVGSLQAFEEGLKEQGLTANEYGALADQGIEGMSDADAGKVAAVIKKMSAHSSDDVAGAFAAIAKQAKSECKVDLTPASE